MADLRIGTSGWNYKHWRGVFYPDGLSQKHWLGFYAEHFDTAEVNYSFYRLPRTSTYEKWVDSVPDDFQFALKCSRLITHNKRLGTLGDLWQNFINNGSVLANQLGPVLCQLPETFECDTERLSEFFETVLSEVPEKVNLRLAMEFRHESWFCKPVYRLLEKHNVACVVASSSRYPLHEVLTADFAYFRYHGPGALFGSNYPRSELESEARKMSKVLQQKMDVFGYFNNDGHGYAVKNALLLKELLKRPHAKAG